MKKLLLSTFVLLLPLNVMAATVLGIQVGGGTWSHAPSGSITSSVNGVGSSADLKDDLQLAEKTEGYSYFLIEHPIPAIPNLKVSQTAITSAGSGAITASFDFNGTTYATSSAVTTKLDLSQSDVIIYYELLDNVVSFDIGLDAKTITGEVGVNTDTSKFSATVPLLYAAVEIAAPLSGFAAGMEMSTISAGGSSIRDMTAKLSYTTSFLLGFEVGVRNQSINIDVSDVKADIRFNGTFAGIFFKF